MGRTIVNHKRLQAKSRTHQVEHLYGGCYKVTSGTSGRLYSVRMMVVRREEGATCSCPWGGFRRWEDVRSGCSHVQALYNHLEGRVEPERVVSAWSGVEPAARQRRPMMDIGDGVVLTSRVKDW